MFKDFKKSIVGILILVMGVVVGVILVRQTQNFKNKAKEQVKEDYTVCHKTGNSLNPWEEITVDSEELSKYLNNGDIFGECPKR